MEKPNSFAGNHPKGIPFEIPWHFADSSVEFSRHFPIFRPKVTYFGYQKMAVDAHVAMGAQQTEQRTVTIKLTVMVQMHQQQTNTNIGLSATHVTISEQHLTTYEPMYFMLNNKDS